MPTEVLYTFRRCPYAMRARWALLNTGNKVLWREVNLGSKPKALIKVSPKATVPVLVLSDGSVIEESIDIILWALENNKNKNLKKTFDVNNNFNSYDLIYRNDTLFKYNLDRYKYYFNDPKIDWEHSRSLAFDILHELDNRLQLTENNYLLSNYESIADWCLWPFVRQCRGVDCNFFDCDNDLNYLKRWLNKYTNSTKFLKLMSRTKFWNENDGNIIFPPIL